jgi:hypothetical protein
MTDEQTRANFEAHIDEKIVSEAELDIALQRDYTGAYEISWVQLGWLYWQAATLKATQTERNFCGRCGKRLGNIDSIHTCTPPTGMRHIDRLDKWLDASLKERKQRQWVGLTRREFDEATSHLEDLEDCWIAIEAKLKERNE